MIKIENRCLVCGDIIPEGRQVCPNCEAGREKYCPYYQGVCGIDERYVCYGMSDLKCNIRVKYEKDKQDERT